jgi:hypothetical protein
MAPPESEIPGWLPTGSGVPIAKAAGISAAPGWLLISASGSALIPLFASRVSFADSAKCVLLTNFVPEPPAIVGAKSGANNLEDFP